MTTPALLIGGTSLESIDGLTVLDWSGLLQGGPYRGDNVVLPGRSGSVTYDKPLGEYTFDVPVLMAGSSSWDFLAILADVEALVPGNVVALTRQLPAADDEVDESSCVGEYVAGTARDWLNETNGTTILQFINCDGAWTPVVS